MSVRHKIVLINGAPGVGKSWFTREIIKALNEFQSPYKRVAKRVKLVDSVYRAAVSMFELTLPQSKNTDEFWNEWKKQKIGNKTGREIIIDLERYGAALDESLWLNNMVKHIKRVDATCLPGFLWLYDGCGMPNEMMHFMAHKDFDSLTVYIGNGEQPVLEGDYKQFDGDSRFDLSRHCTIRAVDKTHALAQTLQALSNRGW